MLLNFDARFIRAIESGDKTHTIRTRCAKVGEVLHCYSGLRHRGARLLGRWQCVYVETIAITKKGEIYLSPGFRALQSLTNRTADGFTKLDRAEREAFARRDGFASFAEMLAYWQGSPGKWCLPFFGYVNHWRRP